MATGRTGTGYVMPMGGGYGVTTGRFQQVAGTEYLTHSQQTHRMMAPALDGSVPVTWSVLGTPDFTGSRYTGSVPVNTSSITEL